MEALRVQQPSWLYQSALAAVLWVSLWALSMLMALAPYESVWFPAAGITFVAMVLSGYRAIPGIAVAIVLTSFWRDTLFGMNAPAELFFKATAYTAVLHISVYWLYAKLFRTCVNRFVLLQKNSSALNLVILFIIIALASSFTNAWLSIEALVQTGMIEAPQQYQFFWSWGFGNAAGLLVMAPICLGIVGIAYPRVRKYLGSMSFQNHAADKGPVLAKGGITL